MRKIGLLLALTFTFLFIISCNSSQHSTDNYPGDTRAEESDKNGTIEYSNSFTEVQTSNPTENEQPQHIDFDKLVEKYVSAINNRDADLIREFIKNNWGNSGVCEAGHAEGILDDYSTVYNNKNVNYRFIGKVPNTGDVAFIYELYNDDGKVIHIQVSKNEEAYSIIDTCFNYSFDVHHMIRFYINLVKSNNPENLVGFFIPEGQSDVYPISDAEETLKKYNQSVDLDTIEYELKDIALGVYIYDVTGTKNGQEVRHEVKVHCGNGLTGVSDEWMPQHN